MDWRDTGILLTTRKHGESSLIIEVFTPMHGRHLGVVRGGASRKRSPHLQAGAQLDLNWKARLEDHIGSFTAELIQSRAAMAMSNRRALAGLNAVTALLSFLLPERDPHPELYSESESLLDLLAHPEKFVRAYLHWEMRLLADLGYGLDLSACAVTGQKHGLVYVSPKTGRAVSAAGAGSWADRLLPLPPTLLDPALLDASPAPMFEIAKALQVTGHFLAHHLAPALGERPLPAARARYVDQLGKSAAKPKSLI